MFIPGFPLDSYFDLSFPYASPTEGISMHSPIYSPGPLQSSSSEETTLEVKQEPTSGQGSEYDTNELDPYRNHDPNDPFDIRNSALYTQIRRHISILVCRL